MSEWSGFMYAAVTPFPYGLQRQKERRSSRGQQQTLQQQQQEQEQQQQHRRSGSDSRVAASASESASSASPSASASASSKSSSRRHHHHHRTLRHSRTSSGSQSQASSSSHEERESSLHSLPSSSNSTSNPNSSSIATATTTTTTPNTSSPPTSRAAALPPILKSPSYDQPRRPQRPQLYNPSTVWAETRALSSTSAPTSTPTSTPTSPRPLPLLHHHSGSGFFSSSHGPKAWHRHRHRKAREAPASSSVDLKDATMYSEMDSNKLVPGTTKQISLPFSRTESISSASGATTHSARTMTSTEPSNSSDNTAQTKPFVVRNGRTYYNDPTLPYPLPCDLTELHRQCLRTLLLIQVYGGPVSSPALQSNPPQKVLEVGCGSGFWSMMCHRYYKERGHSGISFTGIDIAPLAPGSANTPADSSKPDKDLNWRFIQHDLRQLPWPIPDDEFDLVMVKDAALMIPNQLYQGFMEEYIRILKPGGTLELWESDGAIRMLRPHVPSPVSGSDDEKEQEAASNLGAYIMTANTPLSAPLNTFLVEYNQWLSRALEARKLSPVPCALVTPLLIQESDAITEMRSKRMVIPLSEVRWEREGVGGVVTKDGKSYVEMKGKGMPHQRVEKKTLTSGQAALRRTALLTVVEQIQALEPILREASGKSLDEWDVWQGKMMADLMTENGTSWGECLEVGAWTAKKRLKK